MASTDPKNEYKLTTNLYNAMQVTPRNIAKHSIPTERAENEYLLNYVSQIFK